MVRRPSGIATFVLIMAFLLGQVAGQFRQRGPRRNNPPLPGSLNQTRARRILVAGLPHSGASLVAASIMQIQYTVGVTDLDPNSPAPKASDFKDVAKGLFIVIRVTPSEKHTLGDYVDAFRPDVKLVVVRHPAQQLAALGVSQPGESFARQMKNMERSVQYKAAADEVIMFESMFFSRHLVARKLEAAGFTPSEVQHIWEGHRDPHDISSFNMIFCKYCHHAEVARFFKGRPHLGKDAAAAVPAFPGAVVKSAATRRVTTLEWDKAVFQDLEPSETQRKQGTSLCPKLSNLYRLRFPELSSPGAANKWGEVIPRFAEAVKERQR